MSSTPERTGRALVVSVRLMHGRYHGEPEWPPAPGRLFQALVAGSSLGGELDERTRRALGWMESLPPPTVAAPVATVGQEVKLYVPNNDLDAKGGDPAQVAGLRTAKPLRPRIFDAHTPLVYVWPLPDDFDQDECATVCELSDNVYQLGRGLDMAWASAEVMKPEAVAELLESHAGEVYEPTAGTRGGRVLPCPERGSLDSLEVRHAATLRRLAFEGTGKKRIQVFRQPPKARFARIQYGYQPRRVLFELRPRGDMTRFAVRPLRRVVAFTEALRDAAARRLIDALPAREHDIVRMIIGRPVDGPRLAPTARVRLVALPSIGHEHADAAIRRVLVEIPAAAPLRADDVVWAFSGLRLTMPEGVEIDVTRGTDERMLTRYLAPGLGSCTWRSVTPAALPASAARRRIEPTRPSAQPKDARERAAEEARATRAVRQALRHAGVRAEVAAIRVQRESFSSAGAQAEEFARGTRFDKHALWHVELSFRQHVSGPLVIGDGRFLGLGLMAPVEHGAKVLCFRAVSGLLPGATGENVSRALRRAVMSRFEATHGSHEPLPGFVSGHGRDGQPRRRGHLYFTFDPASSRLFVLGPDSCERSGWPGDRGLWRKVVEALDGLRELRAGAAGCVSLEPETLTMAEDPLFAASQSWISRTPYVVNRHVKGVGAETALERDIEASCRKLGLSTPHVEILRTTSVLGVGLSGLARLRFDAAVKGPLLLGKTRHLGGGIFAPELP